MIKKSAILFGAVFIVVGIWGFFSNLILGIFAADIVSNIIHIIVGIILLLVAAKPSAIMTMKVVGILYIIFAIFGFISGAKVLGIFVVNNATSWLYIVLGIVIAVIAWSGNTKTVESFPPVTPQM